METVYTIVKRASFTVDCHHGPWYTAYQMTRIDYKWQCGNRQGTGYKIINKTGNIVIRNEMLEPKI